MDNLTDPSKETNLSKVNERGRSTDYAKKEENFKYRDVQLTLSASRFNDEVEKTLFHLAETLINKGNLEDGLVLFKMLTAKGSTPAKRQLLETVKSFIQEDKPKYKQQKLEQAADICRFLKDVGDPSDWENPMFNVAVEYLKHNKVPGNDGENLLKLVASSRDNTEAQRYLIRLYADQKRLPEAEEFFKGLPEEVPGKYLRLIETYQEQGETAKAEDLLKSRVEKNDGFVCWDLIHSGGEKYVEEGNEMILSLLKILVKGERWHSPLMNQLVNLATSYRDDRKEPEKALKLLKPFANEDHKEIKELLGSLSGS